MKNLLALVVFVALGCATSPAVPDRRSEPLGRAPAERNVFGEWNLPALQQAGIAMGDDKNTLVRGDAQIRVIGPFRCVESSYLVTGEERLMNVVLEVDLRFQPATGKATLGTLQEEQRGTGTDLSDACEGLAKKHAKRLSAAVVQRADKALTAGQ